MSFRASVPHSTEPPARGHAAWPRAAGLSCGGACRPYSRGVGVWNTFVEGDNLDVLPSLAAVETVDLVYIDPPYNTGNAFAYRDDIRGERAAPHEAGSR